MPTENHVNQILIYFNRARIDRMQLQTCHFIVNENQIEASSKCAHVKSYTRRLSERAHTHTRTCRFTYANTELTPRLNNIISFFYLQNMGVCVCV